MINFAGTKRLYLKGTCNVLLTDPNTGDIEYQSNKFNDANISSTVDLGEIRAGLGNSIAAMIPTNSGLEVTFNAADFDLWAKGAQVGATMSYNGVVPTCQTVTATGASLAIDVSGGTPVAQLGLKEPCCYVQTVGSSSSMAQDGIAYAVNPATGEIDGFTATNGVQYKVWYFVQKASARIATIGSLFDPKVVHMTAQMAVYSNEVTGGSSEGTRVGWLYVIVPYLKLRGEANIVGDQSNNDTTSISGQAVAYDDEVVSATCSDCESSKLAYYIYAPDDAAQDIIGLAVVGGVVSVPTSGEKQIPVYFVMGDGSLAEPSSYATGFTFTATGEPTGTTVSETGVIEAGATSGEFTVKVEYESGSVDVETVVNVAVVGQQ